VAHAHHRQPQYRAAEQQLFEAALKRATARQCDLDFQSVEERFRERQRQQVGHAGRCVRSGSCAVTGLSMVVCINPLLDPSVLSFSIIFVLPTHGKEEAALRVHQAEAARAEAARKSKCAQTLERSREVKRQFDQRAKVCVCVCMYVCVCVCVCVFCVCVCVCVCVCEVFS
jgi:hypothetical protein